MTRQPTHEHPSVAAEREAAKRALLEQMGEAKVRALLPIGGLNTALQAQAIHWLAELDAKRADKQ